VTVDVICNRTSFAVSSWATACAVVFIVVWRFEATPGPSVASIPDWPSGCTIERSPGVSLAILFLHPGCPCSMASIEELRLGIGTGWDGDVHVVMYSPDGENEDWVRGEQWEAALRIPRAKLHVDPGGRLAGQFNAVTSGHAAIYDGDGRLKFAGGLTPSRGTTAGGLLFQRAAFGRETRSPVYGCAINAADSCGACRTCETNR
jgi:hypothetical protein